MSMSHLGEIHARMEHSQEIDSYKHQTAVQNHKAGLVLHDMVAPATSHLGNTVDTSGKNSSEGTSNSVLEFGELGVVPYSQGFLVDNFACLSVEVGADADPVVCSKDAEAQKNDDLEGYTGDDGAITVSSELGLVVASGSGDTSTDSLDDNAGDVGGEEQAGVPNRRDARERWVEGERDMLQGQVDGDADEGRGEDNGADLQLKGTVCPGVAVEEGATNVACVDVVSL